MPSSIAIKGNEARTAGLGKKRKEKEQGMLQNGEALVEIRRVGRALNKKSRKTRLLESYSITKQFARWCLPCNKFLVFA